MGNHLAETGTEKGDESPFLYSIRKHDLDMPTQVTGRPITAFGVIDRRCLRG